MYSSFPFDTWMFQTFNRIGERAGNSKKEILFFFSLHMQKQQAIRLSSKGYWGPMTGLLLCISLSSRGEMSWSLQQLYNMTWKRFFRARLRDTSIRSLYPPTLVPYVILAVCVCIQRSTFRFKKDSRIIIHRKQNNGAIFFLSPPIISVCLLHFWSKDKKNV
jgi:hypothetical protein